MAYILKKQIQKRFQERQLKIDDIIVFDNDLPDNCSVSFIDVAPIVKLTKDEGYKSVKYTPTVKMAGGFAHLIMKKSFEKRYADKLLRMDDIVVFDEDLPKKCAVTFVDISPIPKLYKNEDVSSVDHSELIDFANKWLLKSECWDVIGCENVPAIIEVVFSDNGQIEFKQILNTYLITEDLAQANATMHSALSQRRVPVQFRVQLLRLWIKRFETSPEDKLRPIIPQIQCKDYIPKRIKDSEFENIDTVVERVNQSIRNEEINGKIINIQTLACSAQQDWSISVDSTQAKTWIGKFIYILRVFYILRPIHEDEIGFADFVPECLSGGNLFKRPQFESQTDMLRKASKWLSENPEINFCSSSSIDVKLKSMVSIDTKQMSITRETGDFIRIMRIAYTKPKDVSPDIPMSSTLPPPPPVYLENKFFVLHKTFADVKKTLAEFMTRDEWTAQEQYKWILLNCETIFILSSNGLKSSLETNSDQSFQAISSSKLSINRNLFFAIKLYYDVGFYGVDHIKPKPESNRESSSCALI